jgi:hypothetical protein
MKPKARRKNFVVFVVEKTTNYNRIGKLSFLRLASILPEAGNVYPLYATDR